MLVVCPLKRCAESPSGPLPAVAASKNSQPSALTGGGGAFLCEANRDECRLHGSLYSSFITENQLDC